MPGIRQISLRAVLLIPACLLVFSSCNSSRHLAGKGPKYNRIHSKHLVKHSNKRKLGAVKCHHVSTLDLDLLNLAPGRAIKDQDKSDLTLIILDEQDKSYKPDPNRNKRSAR